MSDDRTIVADVGGRVVRFVLPIQPVLVRQMEGYRRVAEALDGSDMVGLQAMPLGLWWDEAEPLSTPVVAQTRKQWRDLDADAALDYAEAVWADLASLGFTDGQIVGMAGALVKAASEMLAESSEVAATVGFGRAPAAGESSAA